jgi:hypothetical protein
MVNKKSPLKSPHLCKGLSPMWGNLMLCLLPLYLLCVGVEKQKIAKNGSAFSSRLMKDGFVNIGNNG